MNARDENETKRKRKTNGTVRNKWREEENFKANYCWTKEEKEEDAKKRENVRSHSNSKIKEEEEKKKIKESLLNDDEYLEWLGWHHQRQPNVQISESRKVIPYHAYHQTN